MDPTLHQLPRYSGPLIPHYPYGYLHMGNLYLFFLDKTTCTLMQILVKNIFFQKCHIYATCHFSLYKVKDMIIMCLVQEL